MKSINKNLHKYINKSVHLFTNYIMVSRILTSTPFGSSSSNTFLTKGYIWVNATATYNYMRNDPIIDWFSQHLSPKWDFKSRNIAYHTKNSKKLLLPKEALRVPAKKSNVSENNNNKNPFLSHIMELGNQFESKVFNCIKKRFTSKRICDINTDAKNPESWQECYNKTKSAMEEGYPFIFGGMVKSDEYHLYGITDLLIRSDWLHLLSKSTISCTDNLPEELPKGVIKKTKSKKDITRRASIWSNGYHYVVVDVKYTTLLLRSDNIHILNTGTFPAYKSQLYIYNICLGEMQGYTPKKSFLLGRRCKSVCKSKKIVSKHCFDLLGTVDFSLLDQFIIKKTNDAIQWIRDLRSEESKGWNVMDYPLDRWELYPNMCNKNDYPWTDIKKQLAEKNKELTMLWNIGPKQRNYAIGKGCYAWGGKECTPKKLNVNGGKNEPILSAILNINKNISKLKIKPEKLSKKNKFSEEWLNPLAIEFFVDFEVTDGAMLPIEKITTPNTEKYLNFIGVGYFDKNNAWIYRYFTMENLDKKEEWKCISNFYDYMFDLSKKFSSKNIRCYHWSKAEQWMWQQALERHKNSTPLSKGTKIKKWTNLEWMDMLDIFKSEPIVLKGCLSFKLKDVAKTMYQYGYIKTTWKEENSCCNGLDAMINMIDLYKKDKHIGGESRIKLQHDLQDYNEVDVKVLAEILQFLRLKYAQKNPIAAGVEPSKKRKLAPEEITPFRSLKRLCKNKDNTKI